MGLEIFYDLHAPANWPNGRVQDIVERVRDFALTLGFAEVDSVLPNNPDAPKTLVIKDPSDAVLPPSVDSTEGWSFRTWPGEGCETALFGLCRFPGNVAVNEVETPTGWGEGWHYHTWCKTQYADRVSREHFLKCHQGVIAILDAFRAEGVEVNVRDGSGYWEHRDDTKLVKQLDDWNRTVAAVAGAIKDAADGSHGTVVSPIFSAPDFERMEAQGHEVIHRNRKKATDGRAKDSSQEDDRGAC